MDGLFHHPDQIREVKLLNGLIAKMQEKKRSFLHKYFYLGLNILTSSDAHSCAMLGWSMLGSKGNSAHYRW